MKELAQEQSKPISSLKSLIEYILTKEEGLTKYQIAQDLGISTSTVLGWGNGTKTQCFLSMKRKLEAYYQIELDSSVVAKHRRGR